ncbi:S-adenosyl-L-methionine-dependent methyltransferase [Hypoxylon rubiginosum]|uniref:S-adenosyl-L-methionine-dependent methyltransferase n=1 Tax=Hypoxylon rubiginosum TaxID=110542 RepID=A0ACB9YIB1_9PEZI|nr:S-adenosyl-L-methionine-dependent methyltransferase [Hypoxylon rubiginosum]
MELDLGASKLQPSPTPDLPIDEPLRASNSDHDISLLDSPPPYSCHDPIPTIEDATDNLGHDWSLTQETVTSLVPEPIRDTNYPSDPEYQPYEGRETAPDIESKETPRERPIVVEIPQSVLTQPRSLYQGFIPPATGSREWAAITALVEVAKSQEPLEDGYTEFDLDDFAIYFSSDWYPNELKPLHHLATRLANDHFYFDGVVSCGAKRFYLKKIPFRQLPIGNYGAEEHTVGDQIWIRSKFNETEKNEIYYKLKSPAIEYVRFYQPFLWIVDLAKHVLDYCDHLKEQGRRAVLYDFKSRFSTWLLGKHLGSAVFERWHSTNRSSDFRAAIVANINFIWKEACGLDSTTTSWHTIWDEVKYQNRYEPNIAFDEAPLDKIIVGDVRTKPRINGQILPTVVTPYVHDLFLHLPFGNVLKRVEPSAIIKEKQSALMRNTRPVEQHSPPTVNRNGDGLDRKAFIASIEPGDVISTKPDDDNTDTLWERAESIHHEGEHLWFGLVQKVHQSPKGNRYFDVIWLYQSIDTPCGVMKYPWNNELFLSNNCTCHHGTAKIQADQILSTHNVEWFGSPSTTAEYFVRQTYLSDECRWTTMKKEHMICAEERSDRELPYKVGDAVLVETNPKILQLETFIVEGFFDEGKNHYARLRKLTRRRDVDKDAPNSPPNEVVYTDRIFEIISRSISRHCLVRAFRLGEKIPTPYNYDGTGNAYFMTHQEIIVEGGEPTYVPLDMGLVDNLRQGFDPVRPRQARMLRGLDLYCGGGNFGRGLEDGGSIEMRWANDIWREAIHTYMANAKPDTCTPFLGSVDGLLLRAMEGKDGIVPQPGDVDFISAGSPCPGFSPLTLDRTTADQRKNQSLIASFASFIDLYRPHYGLLENVPQMVNTKRLRDLCVFSQLVCALVGLGYQVQVMFLDAWSFGAAQTRSRVFLCFSAPGFRMPKVPASSHSHPAGTRLNKLGEMSCGRPFDRRKLVSTPFKFVSASEATKDLPDIQDGKPDFCVGFPDHRLSMGLTPPVRKQIFRIPTQPWEMNFSKAWFGKPGMPPVLDKSDRDLFPIQSGLRVQRGSKSWSRIHPNRLFGTIATRCNPTDARIGALIHWHQHRPMTLMEARRAQGFRDDEVLVGSSLSQWHLIGNSVARQVSMALGLAIREAWFGTLFDEPHLPQTGLAAVAQEPVFENGNASPSNRSMSVGAVDNGILDLRFPVEAESSSSNSPSNDPFLASTPPKTISFTPATTDSNGVSDLENGRKRPLEWYVEITTKKPRPDASPERENHDSLFVDEPEEQHQGLYL